MIRSRPFVVLMTAVVLVMAPASTLLGGDDTPSLRDGFESERTAWQQEQTDAAVNLLAHERSDRAAHEGRFSEGFHFDAGPGSSFYYSYPLPKIPVSDALRVGLFVRS